MHGLVSETSICYWQGQPENYKLIKIYSLFDGFLLKNKHFKFQSMQCQSDKINNHKVIVKRKSQKVKSFNTHRVKLFKEKG